MSWPSQDWRGKISTEHLSVATAVAGMELLGTTSETYMTAGQQQHPLAPRNCARAVAPCPFSKEKLPDSHKETH